MLIFTSRGFAGHWPVGTAAVVVAPDAAEAKRLLEEHLAGVGLPQEPGDVEVEFWATAHPTTAPRVRVLCDGNY
jgi:hypothetical protein